MPNEYFTHEKSRVERGGGGGTPLLLVRGVLITDIQKRSKKKKINERRKKIGRELSLIAKLQKKGNTFL